MTLADLIRRFRVLSNDAAQPYFWADVDITDWLDDAQAQACIRGRLLRDDSRESVCAIALTPGKATYKLHPKLYEIISIRLVPASGRARPVSLKSREWLDANHRDWRDCQRPVVTAIQDDTSIRVVGKVEAGDTLQIEVYRLPLLSLADSDTPEIHEAHHEHLVLWALHKAFSIPDTEAFDAARADRAEAAFTRYFGIAPDSDMRRQTREDVLHVNQVFFP